MPTTQQLATSLNNEITARKDADRLEAATRAEAVRQINGRLAAIELRLSRPLDLAAVVGDKRVALAWVVL